MYRSLGTSCTFKPYNREESEDVFPAQWKRAGRQQVIDDKNNDNIGADVVMWIRNHDRSIIIICYEGARLRECKV